MPNAKTKKQKSTKQKTAKQKTDELVLDATDRVLGRIASDAAFYLQGKHHPNYTPNRDEETIIRITNTARLRVSGKKRSDKMHWRHSGYPGGVYGKTLGELLERDPAEVLRHTIRRMLPANRMRATRLNRLIIEK